MKKLLSRSSFALALFLTLLLLLGCEKKPVTKVPPSKTEKEEPQVVLRIGVVPAVSVIKIVERYQPLMSYLSKKLNIKAQVVPLKDYSSIINQMKSKDLEAGIHGSFSAYMVQKEIGAIPLVRPEKNGVSTYEGYIFTRKDSGIKKISDLKGRSFAYISKTSAGYLYPAFILKQMGYSFDTFFSRVTDAVRQDLAVLAVLNGDVDAGAAKNLTYEELAKENPRINKELVILSASSAKFPEQAIVVRPDLNPSLVQKLKQTLLGMHENAEGKEILEKVGADRYIESPPSDWAELEKMVKVSGISLE